MLSASGCYHYKNNKRSDNPPKCIRLLDFELRFTISLTDFLWTSTRVFYKIFDRQRNPWFDFVAVNIQSFITMSYIAPL